MNEFPTSMWNLFRSDLKGDKKLFLFSSYAQRMSSFQFFRSEILWLGLGILSSSSRFQMGFIISMA